MSHSSPLLTRRDFLKLAGLGLGSLALRPWDASGRWERLSSDRLVEFPQAERLGRNCTADTNLLYGGTIPIKARPDAGSALVRNAYRDEVFPWIREVAAENMNYNYPSQRWVETPEGYIFAPQLQPCWNQPNNPLSALPDGVNGFWAEVTVPYIDLLLDNPQPISGWMRDHTAYDLQPRLYYKQVMWVDQVRVLDSGAVQYHLNERYGNPGDLFWADATAFRLLGEEDVSPIHPEVDPVTKRIVVNLTYQSLSCFEGEREVYYCRVSTGIQQDSTPLGEHRIWRKLISVRMGANTVAASYDLPGIGWTTLFVGDGVAIHATTSHNDFGAVRSHGCVNCRPEDAQWIFRWTLPGVVLDPGEILTNWLDATSTRIVVEDRFL